MNALKTAAKSLIALTVRALARTKSGRWALDRIAADAMERTRTVKHAGVSLTFAVPNALARYRAESFASKEPETLEWIDAIPSGAVLWDIGANVGLYSCYAAKRRGCRVLAFEPSPFNLELLARNVHLNGLADRVTIVPLPLSEALSLSRLNMSSTDWGGAMSTFGAEYGHDGRALAKVFELPTVGLSMADAVGLLKLPPPDFVKLDVDGIEHLILKGAGSALGGVEGLLIEINDDFEAQSSEAAESLRAAGFELKEKRHADPRLTGGAPGTYNQIWVRPRG